MNTHIYKYHTIAETFELICSNENPWIAIGNFLNDWWYYASNCRANLIERGLPLHYDRKRQRWAAFCAAMVETLCLRCNIPCPAWTYEKRFILSQPWFYYQDSGSRARLLATTPTPFKKRNVYVTNRILSGKWDLPTSSTLNPKASAQTDQRVQVSL